jgi:DNA mismatch repair protein MutS
MSGVNNYCIAVKEQGDDIVFLRKIVKGGADKSYGIQVAKLAGVPEPVICRAKELVEELSSADIATKAREIARESANVSPAQRKTVTRPDEVDLNQMTLFDTVKSEDIIKEIEEIQINEITPVEALNILSRMQGKLKNRW